VNRAFAPTRRARSAVHASNHDIGKRLDLNINMARSTVKPPDFSGQSLTMACVAFSKFAFMHCSSSSTDSCVYANNSHQR